MEWDLIRKTIFLFLFLFIQKNIEYYSFNQNKDLREEWILNFFTKYNH